MDGSEYGYTAQDGHTIAGHFATMRDYLNVGFPHELQPEDVADLMPHDIRYVEDIPPPLEMFQLNGVYSEDPSCVMNAGTTGPREPQFLGPTYDVRLDSSYALSETYLYYGNRYRIKSGRFPTPEQFFSADYTRFRNWMYPNPNLLFEPETDVVLQKMRLNAVYQESKQRYSSHPLLKYCSRTEMEANDQVIDDIDDDLFILHFQGCHVFGFHKFVIRNTYRCIVNIMTGSHFPADPFKGVAGWTLDIRQIYVYETAFTLHLCETLLSHPETIPKQILPVAYPMRPVVESESSGSSNATSKSDRSEGSQEDEEEDEQQEEATQCTKTEEVDTYRANGKDLPVFDEATLLAADRFDAGHFGSYRPHTVQFQNMNEYPLPDNFLEDTPPKTSSTSRCSATNIEDEMRNATIEDREDNYHNKPESSGMEQLTKNDNKSVRSETDGETGDDDSEGESTDGSGDSDDTASASDGPEKSQEAEPVKFAIPEAPKRNWSSLYSRPRISAAAAPGGTLAFLAQRKAQAEAQGKQAAAANPLSSFFASRKSETEVQEKPAAEDGSLGLLASRKEQAEVEDTLAAASNSVQEVKNQSSRNEQQAQAAAKAAMYAAMMFPKRAGLEHKPRQYEHKPRQYVSVFQTMLNQKKEQAMAPQPEVVQLPPPVKRKVIHTVHDKPEEEDKKKPSDVPAWAMGLKSATARARKRAEDREGRKKDKANIKSFIGVFKVPGESPDQSRTASPAGSVGSGESPMDAYRRTSRKDGDPSNPTSRNQSPAVCSTTAPSRDSSSDSVRSSTRSSQLSRTPSRAASRERSNSFTTSPIPARLLPSPIAAKAKFLSPFEALRRTGQLRTAQAAPSVQEQQKPTESAPPSSSEALTQPQSIPEQRTVRRSNLAAMFAKQAEQKKNPTPVIVPEPVIKPLGKPEEQVQEATETHETQEPYTESHEEVESTNSGIVLQEPEESEKHEDQPDFSQEYMDQPDTTMDWPESLESTDVWVQPEIVAKPTEKPQSSPKTSQQQRPQQRESVKTVSIPSSQSPVAQPGQKNTSPKQQQARVISYSPKSKTNAAVQGKSATVNQSFPPSVLAQSTPLPRETLDSYRRRMQLNGKPINMSTTMPTIIVASSASPDGRVPVYVPARSDKPVYYLIKKPQQPTVTRNPARPPSRSGAIPTLLKKAQQPVFPVVKSSHLVQQKSPVTGSDNPVVVGRTWGRKKVIMMTEEEMKRERAPIPASVARRHDIFRLPVDQQLPVFLPLQATNARGPVRQRKPSVPKPKQPRRPRARKLSPPRYNETDEHQSATYSFNQDTKEQDAQNSETTEKKKNYNPYIRQYPYTEHSYAELDTGIMRTLPARGRVHPHAVEMEGIVLDIPPEEDEPKVHDKATPTKTSDERQRSPTPPRIGPKRGRPFKGQEIPWTPAVSSKVEKRKPRTRTRNNPDAPEVDTGIYITHERKPKTKRVKAELPAEECAKVQKNIEEAVPETTEPERAKKIVRPRGKKGTLMRKIATALEHQYYRLNKKKSPTNLERIPGSEMAGLLRKAVQYEVSRGEYSLLTRPLPHESRVQKRGRPEPRWIKGMKPILCHVVEKPSSLLAKKMTVDHFDVVVDELSPEEMSKFHKRLQKITVAYQEDLKLKEEIARLALSDDDSELEDEETFEELPSHLKSIVNEMGLREVIVPRIMAEVALLTTTNDTPQGITQCKEVVPEIKEPVYEKPIVEAQPEVVPTEKEEQLNAPNPMGDFVKDLEKGGGNNASGPDGSPSTKESDEPEKRKRGRPKKVVKPRGRKAVLIKAGEWPLPETELDKTAGELQKASMVDAQPEVAEPAEPKSKNIQEQPKRPRGRPKKEKKHLGRQKKQPEEAQISHDLSESVQPSTALSLESLLDDLQTSYHSDALNKNPEEEANVFVDEPAPPASNELAGSSYLSSILINTESEEEKIVHEQAEGTSAVAATEPEESADGPLVSYPPLEEPYAEPSYVFDDEVYTESFDNVDSFSANEPAQWETDDYSEGAVMNELLEQPENEQAVASVAEHVSDSDDDIQIIESEVTSAKENVVLKSPEVVCLDDSDDDDQQEEVENTPTTVNEELIVLDEITSPVSPQRLNEFRADVPAEVDEPHGNAESVDDEDVEDEKEFDELPVHLRKVVSDNFGTMRASLVSQLVTETNLAEPGTLAESEPQRPDEVDDNAMPQLIASDAEQEDEEDFEDFPPELRKIFFSDTYVPKRKLRSYNLAEPRLLAHSETQRPDEVADGVTAADEEPKRKLCPSNSAEPRNLAQSELKTPDEVENNVTSEGMAESSDEELEDEEEFEELPVHLRGEVAKHFATLRNSLVSQLVTESNLAEPGTLAENESERPDEVVNDFMPKVAAESDETLEDEEEFDELPAHLRKVVSENFGTMRAGLVSQLVTERNLAEPGTLVESELQTPDEVEDNVTSEGVAESSDEELEDEEEFEELPVHLRGEVAKHFAPLRNSLISQLVTESNLAEPGTLAESELQRPDEVEDNVTSEGVAESSDEELEDEEEFEELPVHLRGEVAKHFAPLRNSLVSQLVTESNLAEPGTVTNFDNQKSEEVTEKEVDEVADLSIIQKKALLNLGSFNTMQRDIIPESVANSTLAEPGTLFESEQPEEVADVTESQFVTEEAEHDVELEHEKEQSADEQQDAPVLAPVDSQLQASWGFEEEEEEEEEEVEQPNKQNNHLFLEKETPKEQEKLPTSTKSAEEEKEEYQFDRAFNRVFGKMIKYMEETEREKIRPVVIESPETTTVITQPIEEKTAAVVVREFVVCTAKAEIYAETLLNVGFEKTNVDFLKTEDVMFERIQRESAAATYHDTSAHATFTFAANEPTDNISFVYKMRPKAAAQISLEDHETSATFDFVKPSLDVGLCGTIPCKADPVKVAAKFGDARTSLDAIFTRDDANLEAEIWAGRSTEKTLLQIFDVETRLTREDQFRSCEGTMNIPNIESDRLAVRGMTASFTAEDDRQYECSLDMKLPNYGEAEYLSVTTSTVAFESKPSSESVEYVQKLKNYEHQLPLAISDINISLVATPQTEHVEKRLCLKNEAVASFTEGRFAFIKPDPPSFVSTLSLPLRVEEKLSFALVEVDLYNQKTDNMKTEHTFPLKSTGIPQSFLETTMYAELEKPEAEVYRTDEYVFYQKLQKWPVEETFTQPEYPKPSHTETAMNDEELDLLFGTSASTSHIQWPPEGSSALQQTEAPMKVFQDDLTVSAEQPDASPGLISPGVPRTPNFAVSSPSSVASFRPGPDEMMWDENPPSPIASGSNAFSVTPEDDVSRKGAKTSGAPLVANIDEAYSEKKHFRNLEKERRAEEKRKAEQQKEERRREKRLKEERLKEEQRKEERLKEEQRKEERMKEERRKEELRRAEKIKEEQRKEEQRKREQQEKLKQKWIKPVEMREERKREIHRRDDLKRAEARQRELREAEERRIRMEREREAERIKKEKRALKLAKAASQKPTKMPIHEFMLALRSNDPILTRKRKQAMQQHAEKPAKKVKLTEEVEENPKKAKEVKKEKHKHHKEKKESPAEKHKHRQVDEPVLEKPKHRHRHRENRDSTSEKTPETDISTESISSITPPQERQKSPKRRHRHREKRGSTSEKTPETDISTESISSITPPQERQKSPKRRHRHREKRGSTSEKTPETDISTESISSITPPQELQKSPKRRHRHREKRGSTSEKTPETDISTESISSITPPQERQKSPKRRHRHREKRGSTSEKTPETDISTESISSITPPRELQKSPQRDQTSHVSPTPNQDSPTESKSTSPKMTMKLRLGVAIVNDKRHFFKLSPPIEQEESLPKIPSPKIQETEQPTKPLNVIVEPSEQMTEQSVKELPEIRNQDAEELVKDPQTVLEKEAVESVTQHQEILETEADEAVTEDLRRHVGGEPSEIAPEASEEYQQLPENDEDRLEAERCSNAIEAMNEDKNSDDEDEMNQTAHGFITARQQMQQEAAPEDVIDRFEPEIFSQSPEAEIQRNLSEPMHSFIEEHQQVQQDVAPGDVTFQSKPEHSSTAAEPETQSAFSGSAVREEPPLVTISLENDELERLSDMQQKSLSDAIERKQDEDWAIFNQSEKKRKASEMETIEKRPRLEDPFSFCSLEENNRTISGLYDFREHDDSSLAIDIFQGSPLAEHSPLNLATDQFPSPLEEDPMDSFARMEEMERASEQASADLAATSATQMPEAFPTQETSCISNTDLQMSQPSTSTEGNDALSNLLIECNIKKSSAVVAPKANAVEVPVQAEQPSRPTLDEHTTHELDSFFQKDMKNVPEVQSIEHAQNILSGSYEQSVAPNSLPQMQTTPPSAGSVPNHGSLPSNFQNVNMSLYDIPDPTFGSLPQLPPSEFDPVQNLGAMPTRMDQMNQGPNNWNIATEAQTTPMRPQMPLQTMMSQRAPAMTPMHPQGVPPQVQPIGVGTPALQQAAFLNANMPQRPGQQGLVQNQQRMHLQQQAAISQAQGLNMHPGPSSMQQNVMYQPIIQSQNLLNHNVGKIPTQTPLKQDTPTLPLTYIKETPRRKRGRPKGSGTKRKQPEAAIQLQGSPFVASSIYPSPGSVQQHTSPNTMVTASPQQQYQNPSLMIYNNDVGGANSSRVQTRSMANASASNTTVPNPYSKPHEWQNDLPELNLPHGNTQGGQFRQLPPTNANMQMYPGFTCNQPGSVPPNPPPHYQLQSQQMVYSNMPMPIRTQMQMGRPLAPPPYPYPHMQYSQQAPQEQWFFEQPMQQQQQSAQHSAQKMQMQTPSQHYQHQPQQQQQLQQQQLQQQQRQMQLQQQSQFAHFHAQQGYHQGYHHQYPSYAPSAPMGRQLEQHWPINANPPCGSMAVNNPYLDVPKETQHQQVQEEVNQRNMQQWVDERNVNKVAPVVNNQNRNFMPPQNQDLHDIALQKQDVRPFEARLASFIQEIFYGVNMHNSQISVEQITKEISSIAQFSHQRCRRVHITAFNLSINLMEHHLSEMALPLMGNPEFANLPSRNDVLKKLNVTKQHKDGKKTLEWRSSDVYTTPADSLRYLSIGSESNIRRAFENARKQFEWLTLLQNSADKVTLIHVEIASQPRPSDPLKDGHPRQEILSCHDYFVQDVRIALHKSTFDCLRYGPIPMQERPISSSGVEFNSGFADKAYLRPYNNDWSVLECFESGDLVASYLVWNPQLSYHLTHHVQNNTPFGNQDGSYDSNNQGHFGNDPSYDATFDGTFGLPPHPDNTGFSGSSYGNHGGYHGRRMNRLSSEDWNSLITINPEMTLLYPTIVLRCSFAIENVGSNSELLDSFMHTEQSILQMRTIFTNVVLQLKARREKTNQLIEAHKCFSQVWQSSWIVSMLELAKYLYSPTKCVTFQHVDYNILKATMKALYNSFIPAFSESILENHLARAEESAKNLKAEVRDRHFSRMAFSMLDQIYIPKAMLQRLKTKPLWNAEARACSKSAYVSIGYNLAVPTSDLDNIFDREITSKETSKTLHSYIESMGQFSRKASHRRALNTATNTTFFFEETFHSLKMYEEETRGVLRDLQSTPAFDPSIRNVNKRMLDTLPENVMKIMVARYIRQRCEYLTASVVSHGSHAVEMINTYLNKLSKRGITRTPQEVQLVLESNPSNFGLKYRQLCVTEEIKVEKKETPMPARERTKRPASNATLPSIPAKSSRSEEHLTKPKTSIEPSMLPPTLHPPAPSTAPSTVLSVAKKLDYAPSVASVDSGFSSAPSIVLSSDDKPTSTARLRAEESKTIAPLVIQSDLDFVLPKLNNTPMNSPSADSIESVRTRKKKQRSTVSPMRLNTRLMDLKLLAEAADVVEGRSRSSSIDREGSSQPEPKILQPSSLRVLPKKRIVNNVVSDGTHKYSVRIDYFAGTAQIDRKLTVPRTKKLRPEDEPAPIIAHLYNQGKREFKLALKDGKPDWSKMASLASKPPLTPMTPILPGKSSRSQSPTELERSKTSAVPRRLFRKPFLMPEIPERDISKEGSPATSDSGRSLRIEQPVTRREQSVTSTTTTSTESRQLDSDEDIDIEIIDPADSDVEEDKLHIVTDDEDSVLGEASLELNDYLDDAKKQDEPLDLSMQKVIQADPVVGHPQIKVEARTESSYGMNTQKDWEILDWDTPGCSQSPGISLEDLTLLKISHDDSPAPEDLTAKGPKLPIDQLQKLTFKTEDIVIPKPKTIAPKLKAKKPKKFATPCRPKDKYIRRQSTRFAEIMTEDEPPEIVTDLTNHLENMDSVRSAVEAAERERKRMFTTVACDSVVRQEARDRSRRLIAPKIAKRSKSADRWLGRTIYKHFGEFWVLGLARLAQPKKVPKKNQFEQVSRCNTPATIAPWDDDYQNCIQEEELPPPPQQLVFPVHESFRQAEQSAIRNPATVWATYHQETPEDRNTKKPAGPSFFRNRRNRRH